MAESKMTFWSLSALATCIFLASLGTSIANIALPTIAEAFAAPFDKAQMVLISYLSALTLTAVVAGKLGDMFGHKQILVAGLIIYGGTAAVCGFANSLNVLIWARAGQGAGAAFLMTLTLVLVRDIATPERTGRVMGLLGTMSALGTAAGPSFGGVLLDLTGWQSVFLCLLPLTCLAISLVVINLKSDKAVRLPPISGLTRFYGWSLGRGLFMNLLVSAVMMTTLLVGPFYLGGALGLDGTGIGLIMSVGPVISIISGIPSGKLVDRKGTSLVMIFGLVMLAGGSFSLTVFPEFFGVFGYIFAIAILTPGYQLFQAANNTEVMNAAPASQRGIFSGLLGLSRNLGLVFGASVMGMIFAVGVGMSEPVKASPTALTSGMQVTFLIAGMMMLIAVFIAKRPCAP